MAPMYGLPLQHTVHDVMATERNSIVQSGNDVWRETIDLAGWDIPDSKSPKPSDNTCLLGADIRHDAEGSVIDITEARVDTLEQLIMEHLNSNLLAAGAAGKLWSIIGHEFAVKCKYGRAKLGPIKSRQYDHHNNKLTNQLRAALLWWADALRNRVPRPVPLERVRRSNLVITYSDGEGSGGVGIVIFGDFPDGLCIWKSPLS